MNQLLTEDERLLRQAFIVAIYPDPEGFTLRQLGEAFAISVEGVRQQLKTAGFTQMRKRGPRPNLVKRAARLRCAREKYFGCDSLKELYQQYNEGEKLTEAGSIYRAYKSVQRRAAQRGLHFSISFLDYRSAWLEVGGRQFGSYRGRPLVLAMADKEAGYTPANVGVVDRVACNATRGGKFAHNQRGVA